MLDVERFMLNVHLFSQPYPTLSHLSSTNYQLTICAHKTSSSPSPFSIFAPLGSIMLTIRRYQSSAHAAVCELHKTALLAAGPYIHDSPFNADLDQIEAVYLDGHGEFL